MDRLVSVSEAAAECGRSVSVIRQRCQEGRIRGAIRIGNRWAIPIPVVILPPARPVGRPPAPGARQ